MKQSYLVGRRVDALLRNYFKYMDTVYGKGVAIATAIEKDNIKDSLSQYSGSFASYKDSDLYVSMFKVVMTSKEVNDSLEYARRKIESGEIDDIIMDMESSLYFRKDIVETYGDNWSRNPETYIVNGPYIMTERKQDEKIVMEVNSNYYDKDYIVAEKINILIMDDSNTALAAMKNGDLQFSVIEAPMGEIPSLMKENYILQEPAYGIYFLEINSQKGVLTNKNIRKALSLAFDRNYIISNVTKMNQIPAGAFVSPNLKDYDGKDFRENGGNYIDIDNYQNNVEEAKKLMADAGYPNGENFPVLEIRTTPGYFTLICEAIQDMYRSNLGIDILIKSEEYNATYQAMIQKDYDLARTGWTADFSDPMAMLNFFSKTSAVNHTGFESEEFNNLLEFASKTQNQKERMEALHKAENILFDYMPVIPIIYRMDPFMISPKLKGAIFNPLGRYKFNYAYIEK